MKSEYDRNYQWHYGDDDEDIYLKKEKNRDSKSSEPRMTHKRRVKLTEDNVVIGEPLLHQTAWEKKEKYVIPTQKTSTNDLVKKEKCKKDKITKMRFVSEAVQTDDSFQEKSTQYSKKVPEINGKKEENNHMKKEKKIRNVEQWNNKIDNNEPRNKERRDNNGQNKDEGKENRGNNNKEGLGKKREVSTSIVKTEEANVPAPAKTEYQKCYSWREPIANGPIKSERTSQLMSSLDTKLKIYNNFMSEYQRQFRPYEYVTENRYKKMKPTFESDRIVDDTNLKFVSEKVEHRRAVTPPPRVNLKKRSQKVEEAVNPQRASFPHGKQKRFLTEYSANYDNKWDRLDAEMQKSVEERAREANSQSKWFREILELRQKAQEYRKRARGTHFSREHLGQVFIQSKDGKRDHRRSGRRRGNERDDGGVCDSDSGTCSNGDCVVDSASVVSSSESTVVGKSKSLSHSPSPQGRTAGKPTRDDSQLLDEEASHDTSIKSVSRPYTAGARIVNPVDISRPYDYRYPVKNERQYTLEKYIGNNDSTDENRKMKTIDYDSVSKDSSNSKLSNRSIISSSTMSLALETLERAKRNRDDVLRQKS